MPRDARIDIENHWYHLIARGQRREPLFLGSKDKIAYLDILSQTLERNGAELGAYCLMTNHVHLLVYRRGRSLGTIFRQAHRTYAEYFNRRHRKTGYVFQGRPKSFLVLDERYLEALVRYIHLNPVAAEMVKHAENYRWSSDWFYRGNALSGNIRLVRVPGFEGSLGTRAYRKLIEYPGETDVPRYDQYIGEQGDEEKVDRRKPGRARWSLANRRGRVPIRERLNLLLSAGRVTLKDIQERTKARSVSSVRQRIMSKLYGEGYPPCEISALIKRSVPAVILAHSRAAAKC